MDLIHGWNHKHLHKMTGRPMRGARVNLPYSSVVRLCLISPSPVLRCFGSGWDDTANAQNFKRALTDSAGGRSVAGGQQLAALTVSTWLQMLRTHQRASGRNSCGEAWSTKSIHIAACFRVRDYCWNFYEWKKKFELRKHCQVGSKVIRKDLGRNRRKTFYCPQHQPLSSQVKDLRVYRVQAVPS